MTETRDEALQRLVHEGVLSAEQAVAVRDALDATTPRPARARWAEVAGYVGGGLLLAGALSLTATSWADLTRTAHIVILLAATAALSAAGIVLIGARPQGRATTVRGRSGSVSMAVASITAALAAGEIATDHPLTIAAATGLLVAATGYALVRAAPGVLTCAVFAALAAGSLADDLSAGSTVAVGLSLVGIGDGGGRVGLPGAVPA